MCVYGEWFVSVLGVYTVQCVCVVSGVYLCAVCDWCVFGQRSVSVSVVCIVKCLW